MRDFPGGLFHPSDDKQEVAFRYAAEKINANRDILPKSRLSAQVEVIQPQDSFHASKRGESHNRIGNTRLIRETSSHLVSSSLVRFKFLRARSIIFFDTVQSDSLFSYKVSFQCAEYSASYFNSNLTLFYETLLFRFIFFLINTNFRNFEVTY